VVAGPESLAAADVHIVSVAESAVGVSHSCKIYGALAVGRPVLVLAPAESHVADIVRGHDCGWVIEHGDQTGLRAALDEIASLPLESLRQKGESGRRFVNAECHRAHLVAAVCDIIGGEKPVVEAVAHD